MAEFSQPQKAINAASGNEISVYYLSAMAGNHSVRDGTLNFRLSGIYTE